MASFTGSDIDKVFSPISGVGGGTLPILETPTGGFANAQCDADGAQKVAIAEPAAGLAKEAGGNLAAILAKLSADPATQTTLAALLARARSPKHAPITPSDATDVTALCTVGVLVGSGGTLLYRTANLAGGDPDLSLVVQAGQYVFGEITLIKAATTAGGLVGLAAQ